MSVTPTEIRVGRRVTPLAAVVSTRVSSGGRAMSAVLVGVFLLLCLERIRTGDPVGCGVFAASAALSALSATFPRRALMLRTDRGEERVMAGWNPAPLLRGRIEIEAALTRRGASSIPAATVLDPAPSSVAVPVPAPAAT
ncbi:MAG: hypothetical protein INR65_13165 [Gluconacetobacter diazotrophicus]|nr:hypothetical protein [Gluconacetobacter diazotrophicus]